MAEATTHRAELSFERYPWIEGFFLTIVATAIWSATGALLTAAGLDLPRWASIAGTAAFAVVALVLPALLLWARQPRGAAITWDERGITEWDGDSVRVAIPWGRARCHVHRTESKNIQTGLRHQGIEVQVTDGGERRIVAANALGSGDAGLRRARMTLSDLERLASAVESRAEPGASPIEFDRLNPHRPGRGAGRWLARGAAFVGYPGLVLGAGLLGTAGEAGGLALPAAAIGTAGLSLLLIRPAGELVALVRRGRGHAGAARVELICEAGSLAARDERGRRWQLDVEGLDHPDGLLAERGGEAWVAGLPTSASDTPYREASVVRPTALETVGHRRARRRLIRAVVAELAARGSLVAFGVAVIAYLLA